MYYRTKVLLGLIEAFGGSLTRTNCQKLMLLFCQQTQEEHYSFFPHKYGGYSFVLLDDKGKLTRQGYLEDKSGFKLAKNRSFLEQLRTSDQLAIKQLRAELTPLTGTQLIRKAYLKYPVYTSRSTILTKLFNNTEKAKIQTCWNSELAPTLFTVGYEGISIDAYLHKLITNNIKLLIDVRKNPLSRKYGFSKSALSNFVQAVGIKYVHLPQLGIASHLREDLNSEASYSALFQYYATEILPTQTDSISHLKTLIADNRVALTCFEADYNCCHRHKITEHLESEQDFSIPIVHL